MAMLSLMAIDRKSLHQDASDSHHDIREHNAATRVPSQQERQHLEAMEYLGLEDGDDAVQYALMLSMEEHGRSSTYGEDVEFVNATDDEVEALRAVEVAKRAEEEEMREVLEMSQLHVKGRS